MKRLTLVLTQHCAHAYSSRVRVYPTWRDHTVKEVSRMLVLQSIWNVNKLYDAGGPRLRADTYHLLDILKAYEAHSFQHRGLSRDSHWDIGTLHPTPNRS